MLHQTLVTESIQADQPRKDPELGSSVLGEYASFLKNQPVMKAR